jgi:hypothetical protein
VNDADKVLKVTVSQGGNAPVDLPLKARYGNPGKYTSYFEPTTVGAYSFHITGTLKDDKIDETFTSGPNTFGEAGQLTLYPNTQQGNSTANTSELQQQVKDAQAAATNATYLGIAGGVVGLIGLIVAGIALARKPSTVPAAASKTEEDLRG